MCYGARLRRSKDPRPFRSPCFLDWALERPCPSPCGIFVEKKNQTSLQTMEEMISKVRCGEGPLAFRGSPSHRVPDSGSRLPSPSRIDSLKVRGGTRKAEGVGRIHDRNRNRKHSNVACFDWRLVAFAATYGVHPSLLRCLLLVGTRYCT